MSIQPPPPRAIPLRPIEQFLLGHFVPVQSTYCVAIAWNPETSAIGIKYDDGAGWWYFPYSRDEAISLFTSPSKGQWAWTFIRVRGKGNVHRHRRGAVRFQ